MQAKLSAVGFGLSRGLSVKRAECSFPVEVTRCLIHSHEGLTGHTRSTESRQGSTHRARRKHLHVVRAKAASGPPVGVGEIADVEDVAGLRVLAGEDNRPIIEYLIKWKDGADPTWEAVENLSDNLLRDFEDKWWKACREGDEEVLQKMIQNSREVLPHCVDKNERSALHYAAAVGQAKCCAMLCQAGADLNLSDKDGYTPLHMAVGYSHVACVMVLLDAGASPDIPDNQGRNVVQLVDSIRDSMPLSPQLASKRIALEEVSALLTGNLFEEVLPRKVLEARTLANGKKEFLVQWMDGSEDSWVKQSDMAKDVIDDFEAGLEYAAAECLTKMKRRGEERLYLVKWQDDSPDSWEFEDNLSPELIAGFEATEEGQRSLKLEEYQEGGYGQAGLPELHSAGEEEDTEEDNEERGVDRNGHSSADGSSSGRNGSSDESGAQEASRKMEAARV